MNKKVLKITVGVISIFPVLLGIMGMINGLGSNLIDLKTSDPIIFVSLDGNKRYLSSLLLMFGFLNFWILPKFDNHVGLFRLLLIFLFIGGLARTSSILIYGSWPAPLQQIVLYIELIIPLILIPWHISIFGFKHNKSRTPNSSAP